MLLYGEQPINSLVISRVALGISWDLFGQQTGLDVIHSYNWRLHLMARDVQLRPHFLYNLAVSFRLSSYTYIFEKASAVLGFHLTPQMPLSFSCFSLYSLPHPHILILSLHCYVCLPAPSIIILFFSGPWEVSTVSIPVVRISLLLSVSLLRCNSCEVNCEIWSWCGNIVSQLF